MGFTTEDIFGSVFGSQAPGTAPRPGFPELLLGAVGSASQDARSPIARGLGAFSGVLGQQLGTERNDPQAAFLRQIQQIPFEPPKPTTIQTPVPSLAPSLSGTPIGAGNVARPGPPLPPSNVRQMIAQIPVNQRQNQLGAFGPKGIPISQALPPSRLVSGQPGTKFGVQTPGGFQQTGEIKGQRLQTPTVTYKPSQNDDGSTTIKALKKDHLGRISVEDTGEKPADPNETLSLKKARRGRLLSLEFQLNVKDLELLEDEAQDPKALSLMSEADRKKSILDFRREKQRIKNNIRKEIERIRRQVKALTGTDISLIQGASGGGAGSNQPVTLRDLIESERRRG